ncbi:MAG: Gldg family protein [Gammaproteobacteria bacterium]|nr:Gldg family protein [Gammaproteobacteria bacterium]
MNLAILRHEMRQFLYSPLTYIFQIAFLTALSLCIFLVADFYASDDASARLLLTFLPWVALILVPAVCARAWVDEPGDRSLELMSTLPVSVSALVVGKFLAAWLLTLITLVFTAPFVVSLYWLGHPDGALLMASYLGAAALLAVYVAVALFMASLVRDQVSAFVLGMVMLFVLLILGWDVLRSFVNALDLPGATQFLLAMSPKTWLGSMGSGVIRFKIAAAFAGVTGVALYATGWMLAGRKSGADHFLRRLSGLAMVVAGLVAAALLVGNRIGANWYLDLTDEKEFTLAPGSLEVLRRLPDPTAVTLYWSTSQAEIPVAVRAHARRVSDLLDLMAAQAGAKITLSRIDPAPDTDAELDALRDGMQRVPMTSGDYFYLGAVFRHGDRAGRIPYFDNRRERLLEYDLMVALNGLSKTAVPKVGILSPLVAPSAVDRDPEGLSFLTELRQAYDVAVVPYFKERLPDDLDVLVVIAAGILRRDMLYAIDQFVMRGGSLIVLTDPFLRLHRASNQVEIGPSPTVDDISDVLLAYGLNYIDQVVGDASLGAPVSHEALGTLSYPYWLRVGPAQLSDVHPVTASLHDLLFAEPGAFKLDNPDAQVLVATSEESGAQARDRFAGSAPAELAAEFVSDQRRRVIAAAVGGRALQTAYPAAPGDAPSDHRARSDTAGMVFAVADVDWIYDTFSLQAVELDGQRIVRPLNDNTRFLLNMIEYGTGDPALLSIRSRGRLHRSFTLVEERFRQAEKRHREQRAALTNSVSRMETRIAELLENAGVDSVARLPAADRDRLLAMQRELLPLRRELREVRREIRGDVEALGRAVAAFNILTGPLLVLALAACVFALRRRRPAQGLAGFVAVSNGKPF